MGYYNEDLDFNRHPEYNDYLMHYGVKGMKWGVRRKGLKSEINSAKSSMRDNRGKINESFDKKTDALWKGKGAVRPGSKAHREILAKSKPIDAQRKAALAKNKAAFNKKRNDAYAKYGTGRSGAQYIKDVATNKEFRVQYAKLSKNHPKMSKGRKFAYIAVAGIGANQVASLAEPKLRR